MTGNHYSPQQIPGKYLCLSVFHETRGFFYYHVGLTIIIPGLKCGNNLYKLTLLLTASRDKAFLVKTIHA